MHYFLDNLSEVSVSIETFNELVGYQRHYTPRGFSIVNEEKISGLIARFGSVEGFLNYLAEGKWVERDAKYPKEVRREIMRERVAKQVGKTPLLEGNLENFLAERVNQIEPGLKLMDRQLDTKEVGRLDLLCEDKDGNLVVVELKKFKAGSSIIDQIQRYMGWIIAHRSKEGQKVRGIIIVGSKDTALEYAARANPLISVKVFTIAFEQQPGTVCFWYPPKYQPVSPAPASVSDAGGSPHGCRVRPGKDEDFLSALTRASEAIAKTKWPGHGLWYVLANGGPAGTYVLVLSHANWADFEDKPDMKPFAEMLKDAFGQAEADSITKRFDSSIESETTEIIEFRADLSYLPNQDANGELLAPAGCCRHFTRYLSAAGLVPVLPASAVKYHRTAL